LPAFLFYFWAYSNLAAGFSLLVNLREMIIGKDMPFLPCLLLFEDIGMINHAEVGFYLYLLRLP